MNRRSFLKLLGSAAAAAAVAPQIITQVPTAPLFIPPQRLEMGVPRHILTSTEMPTAAYKPLIPESIQREIVESTLRQSVAMLLLHNQYSRELGRQYGNPRIPAGATLMVNESTALRWIERGIGVPAPSAPVEMQRVFATRNLEKQKAAGRQHFAGYKMTEARA